MLSLGELLLLDVSASEARARRTSGIHRDRVHASFFRFALQDRDELGPADIVDGLRETTSRKAADVQVFERDQVESTHERQCRLAVKVQSLVADMLVRSRDTLSSPSMRSRSTFFGRQRSLCSSEAVLSAAIEPRVRDLLAARKRREGRQTEVDPGCSIDTHRSLRWSVSKIADDLHEPPASRVAADRDVTNCSFHETVLLEADAAEPWHVNVSAATLVRRRLDDDAADPKRIVSVARAEAREAGLLALALATMEERLVRPFETTKCRSLNLYRYYTPVALLTKFSKFSTLGNVRDRLAVRLPCLDPLLKRRVVERTTLIPPPLERRALMREPSKRKTVRMDHSKSLP